MSFWTPALRHHGKMPFAIKTHRLFRICQKANTDSHSVSQFALGEPCNYVQRVLELTPTGRKSCTPRAIRHQGNPETQAEVLWRVSLE